MKRASTWESEVAAASELLGAVSCRDASGGELGPTTGFRRWVQRTSAVRVAGRRVFLVGNGASASMASHLAADLSKNGGVQTEVFTDVALLTAVANDLGYEQVFAEPLRNRCRRGDMLVAISSSGESPNVLAAAHAAVGMLATVVTLTAMRADNRLRRMGALNFYVPAKRYGPAESCHAVMLHHWMDRVQDSWCGGRWRCGRSGQTAVSVRVEE